MSAATPKLTEVRQASYERQNGDRPLTVRQQRQIRRQERRQEGLRRKARS